MIEDVVAIPSPAGEISALRVRPEGPGPFPVIVLFHDGPGVRADTWGTLQRIAAGGYYVIAPDRYHRYGRFLHIDPATMNAPDADPSLRKQMFHWLTATTEQMVSDDLDAVLAFVGSDPAARSGRMGCIGFCAGARSSVLTACRRPDVFVAAVGLHPSFCVTDQPDSPHLGIEPSGSSFYIGIGEEDQMQSVAMNQAMLDVLDGIGERGEYDIFPGADHGFAVPGFRWNQAAADTSYAKALALYDRVVR